MAKKKAIKKSVDATPPLGEEINSAAQEIAEAIGNSLTCGDLTHRRAGMPYSAADAIANTAEGLDRVAEALRALGLNSASTPLGAIELLAKEVLDGTTRIAESIHALAKAVAGSGK